MGITQKNILTQPVGVHLIEPNLYLKVQKAGASFVFRYAKNGRRCDVGVGSARKVTIARAKEIAALYRAEVAAGREPKRKEAPAQRVRTFREVAADAIDNTEEVRRWKSPRHRRTWEQPMEDYAYPLIGAKKIKDLTRQDVIDVLRPIWQTKNPTAAKLRSILERVFECAIFGGEYSGANPARYRGNLDIVLPSPARIHRTDHHAAMTLEEAREAIRRFVAEQTPVTLALAILMLTALRCTEVTKAEWGEMDLSRGLFTVPAIRRKVARDYPHRVPLSAQAVAILRRAEEFGAEGYVFKSPIYKGQPISHHSPLNFLAHNFPGSTVHGFRSTFRVWAEETEQNTTAAEYQMMHENPSEVVRAYQRSDLLEQRRVLMQRWADALLPLDELDRILV